MNESGEKCESVKVLNAIKFHSLTIERCLAQHLITCFLGSCYTKFVLFYFI